MCKKVKKKTKVVSVKEHPRRVQISNKNPNGITIVDKHLRHIDGYFLDNKLIGETILNYNKKDIQYPADKKIKFQNADKFDDLIAVWCDYFNNKLSLNPKIDPDMVKALMASESSFNPLAENKNALGLTQVTKDTLKILQDLDGEVKDFVFKDIRQKDLKDPNVSIALGVRWLAQKQRLALSKLKRAPTSDEVVMMYKGILNDKSSQAKDIMIKYRDFYAKLKK